MLFHQGNTQVHIRNRSGQNHLVQILIPSSSTLFPRFSPLGFFALPKLEKKLGSKRFSNNEEMEFADTGYFEGFGGSHYKQAIVTIEHRREICIELKRDYVEK